MQRVIARAFSVTALVCAATPGAAKTFGEMFKAGEGSLLQTTGFIAVTLYVVGVLIVLFGLLGLIRAVRAPQYAGVFPPILMIAVGAGVVMLPEIINAVQTGFGGSTATRLQRPSLE